MNRIEDLLLALQKKEEEKPKKYILWALAVIGAITAVAGIAYAVYRYLTPDYLEDFDDDIDDDFDDYFEDEDLEEAEKEAEEEKEAAEEDEAEEEVDQEEIFVDEEAKEEPATEE